MITNIGHFKTIQIVSIIYLLIYLIDIKHVHFSLQCPRMIATNIGDYETIQFVSIIFLLIYLIDIKHVHSPHQYQPMIVTNILIITSTARKYNILINLLNLF